MTMIASHSFGCHLRSLLAVAAIATTAAFAGGGVWEFEYTGVCGLGPVSTVATDSRNNDTEFDVDRYGLVLDRKVEETRANAGGSGVQLRKWTYDAVGRELSFQKPLAPFV